MADNASSYPGTLDTFTARAATMNLAAKHSDDHDKLRDAVVEIETELGTAPSGASATVAARFTAIEAAAVQKTGSQTMAGPLTVTNAITAAGLTTTAGIVAGTTVRSGGDIGTFNPGSILYDTGPVQSRIEDPTAAATPNLYIEKAGATAGAVGAVFADFRRTASTAAGGTQCGSITLLAGGVTIAYNTSSDYRLKDDRGLVVDPVTRLMELKPRHFAWKEDGAEADGFYAHELADVVPYAVTGEKDGVNKDGSINVQQIDRASLIPLLVAAVQELAGRVAVLEAG